jgi:hypothetical protein
MAIRWRAGVVCSLQCSRTPVAARAYAARGGWWAGAPHSSGRPRLVCTHPGLQLQPALAPRLPPLIIQCGTPLPWRARALLVAPGQGMHRHPLRTMHGGRVATSPVRRPHECLGGHPLATTYIHSSSPLLLLPTATSCVLQVHR